ncbi:hypothetical protein HLB03_12905 [Acidianus sp. DSM 29099]|nr:hypothetical protein [Acidianus sp. RZ1]
MTSERTIKLLQQLDLDSLLSAMEVGIPVMQKMLNEKTIKMISQMDIDSMMGMMDKVAELQRSGALDRMMKLLDIMADPQLVDSMAMLMEKMSKMMKLWTSELGNVKPAGGAVLRLAGFPQDQDTRMGLGIAFSLLQAMGKAFKE